MTTTLSNKTVAILIAQEFEDLEFTYPLLRLSEEGANILVAALPLGFHPRPFIVNKPVTGRFGTPAPIPVMPEGRRYHMIDLDDLRSETIDGLVIPGGFSPDYLRRHAGALRLVSECHQQGKLVAAICHGPWVLISAGVARGRRMTGNLALRDDLINAGAEFCDEPVVVDGNIVTSRMPNDLPEFCGAIINHLKV